MRQLRNGRLLVRVMLCGLILLGGAVGCQTSRESTPDSPKLNVGAPKVSDVNLQPTIDPGSAIPSTPGAPGVRF